MLADSNIVIYAARPENAALRAWAQRRVSAISAVTLVEVLGYPKLSEGERERLAYLTTSLTVFYPGPKVIQRAIALRQQRKMSLGDALIAATALEYDLTLATHNTADFAWIAGLSLLDPLEAS